MPNKTLKICAGLLAARALMKQSEPEPDNRQLFNFDNFDRNELCLVDMASEELLYSFKGDISKNLMYEILGYLQGKGMRNVKIVSKYESLGLFKKWKKKKSLPKDYYCRRPNPDTEAGGCPLKRFSSPCT